jgi:Ran-binding protein 9/10
MGRYITTTGTAGTTIREVSSAFNASVNDRILANSSGGAFTITLPANGSLLLNDTIQIMDVGGSAGSNNITISRNGSKIQGLSENLVMDVNGSILTLTYTGSNYGWIVASA